MKVIPGRLLQLLEEGKKRFNGPGSARSEASRAGGDEELMAYELLHKEHGFQAFRLGLIPHILSTYTYNTYIYIYIL